MERKDISKRNLVPDHPKRIKFRIEITTNDFHFYHILKKFKLTQIISILINNFDYISFLKFYLFNFNSFMEIETNL